MQIQYESARKSENFPVASWLLPRAARAPILAFYDFARGADNIADDASRPASERKAELQQLDAMLEKKDWAALPDWAQAYGAMCQSGRMDAQHGRLLLRAFIQDTVKQRYDSWEELMLYCQYSAAPVGQAVLYACGETTADGMASDHLCYVLQVLNHLQDCKQDYMQLDRVYIPQRWMGEQGVQDTALAKRKSSKALRKVQRQMLDKCDQWLRLAEKLPPTLRSRRLRLEIRFILAIAHRLRHKLHKRDPLKQRVQLSKWDYARCFWKACNPS